MCAYVTELYDFTHEKQIYTHICKGIKVKVNVIVTQLCPTLCNPMDCPRNSPGQSTGVGGLSLLQGIFPMQGTNLGLPHCRRILYQLSPKGSSRILEWVAYPFSRGSSTPGIEPRSPTLQEDSLPIELSGKPVRELRQI